MSRTIKILVNKRDYTDYEFIEPETNNPLDSNDYKFIDKILKQKKIDFVAVGRKFISDKFFLFKDRKQRKNDFPKQYTYCI